MAITQTSDMIQTAIWLSRDMHERLKKVGGYRGLGEEVRRRLQVSFDVEEQRSAGPRTGLVKGKLYLPARSLRLADTLDLGHPWGTAIVKRIEDGFVTVWRPYGTTASFSTTGGAICYVGLEEFKVPTSGDTLYTVVQRTELM